MNENLLENETKKVSFRKGHERMKGRTHLIEASSASRQRPAHAA